MRASGAPRLQPGEVHIEHPVVVRVVDIFAAVRRRRADDLAVPRRDEARERNLLPSRVGQRTRRERESARFAPDVQRAPEVAVRVEEFAVGHEQVELVSLRERGDLGEQQIEALRVVKRAPEARLLAVDPVDEMEQDTLGVRLAVLQPQVGVELRAGEDRPVVRQRPDAAAVVGRRERMAVGVFDVADGRKTDVSNIALSL